MELEEHVDVYLLEEFLDKEPIRTKIDEVRRKLECSAIFRSKQHRLKVSLDDIAQNCYRVQTTFKRLAYTEGEEQLSSTLKQLALEELLSEEQHLELAKALLNDDMYSEVNKNTKVGQGRPISKVKRSGEKFIYI